VRPHSQLACCADFESGDAFTVKAEVADHMRDVTRNRAYTVALVDVFGLTFRDDVGEFSVVHGDHVRQLSAARKLGGVR